MNEREIQLNMGAFLGSAHEVDPQTPFRILICGDFSGRANRGVRRIGGELASRKPVRVDRDNFDEVLIQLDVKLEHLLTSGDGKPVSIGIQELDDFHPDRLFESVGLFESLRGLRRRLLNRATFDEAAAEMRGWAGVPQPAQSAPPPAPNVPENPPASLLEGVLAETGLSPRQPEGDWNQLIQEIIAPYVVPGADPRQDELVACADSAVSKSMQMILHHADFRQIEAAWRGLYLLVRRLETDASLQLHVLDISKQELAADLAGDDVAASGLYRALVEKSVGTPGATPWGAFIGDFVFGPDDADIRLLDRMARVAAAAGAPWLAAAHGSIVGCPDPRSIPEVENWQEPAGPAWQALRQLPASRYVTLLWPRFLLRLPYGAKTSPIRSFQFEESSPEMPHEHLLWGNAAFLAALALGEAFVESGWALQPGLEREIDGLPVFVMTDAHGEKEPLPCAELWLRERGAARVTSVGVTPVLSIQGADAVRLGKLASLNGGTIAGRWN